MGSAPGESTKIMGDMLVESLYAPSKSNGGDSINCAPNSVLTNSLMQLTIFSSLNTF